MPFSSADWLVDRKKVPPDWRKKLAAVQARLTTALQALPRDINPWFLSLSSESIGYLEAKRVRDVLAAARPQDRNIFGRYSGLTGKDVRKELQGLVRELPAIFRATLEELTGERVGQALEYYRAFVHYAHSPEGEAEPAQVLPTLTKLREEPPEVPSALPSPRGAGAGAGAGGTPVAPAASPPGAIDWGFEVTAEDQELREAVESEKANPNTNPKASPKKNPEENPNSSPSAGDPEGSRAEGDEPSPPSISWDIDVDVGAPAGGDSESANELQGGGGGAPVLAPAIDWGISAEDMSALAGAGAGSGGSPAPPQVDWGIDAGAPQQPSASSGEDADAHLAAPAGICWDIEIEEGGLGESDAAATQPAGINWDIDVGEGGTLEGAAGEGGNGGEEEGGGIDWGIGGSKEEGSGRRDGDGGASSAGGAKGTAKTAAELLGPLAQTGYRNQLLDDLYELHAFLRQRVAEMGGGGAGGAAHGADSLAALDGAVRAALGSLTARRTRDLLLILTSPRFVERLQLSLQQKAANEARLLAAARDLGGKRMELRNSVSATRPKQDAVMKRTREVKDVVEATLSAQYSGRPVNIIGEINNVLGAP
eukprot:jgi/Mesen1/4624/ME000237S03659